MTEDRRRAILDLLQERLSALPTPEGTPPLRAEQLLAYLQAKDPDAGDPHREALIDATLLSALEAFISPNTPTSPAN
ncbi:hypothetical protein [Streptomyces sp. NPDC097619]|uniref:hypothetical protein n=1 Tax=Streptomyces sp. NPDC097619 TaxID=3157228 RepID=UPI00331F8201